MKKRFLACFMLFVLIFSSLYVFAMDDGGELKVSDASFTVKKNQTLEENLPTVADESDLTYEIVTQPSHGTLTYNDTKATSFSYEPNSDYVGQDSFTFKVKKEAKESNTATITITVEDDEPKPQELTITDATFKLEKNTILTSNLPSIEGQEDLKYVIVSEPQHGSLTHSDESSASFSYTPELDYVGEDTFTFKVTKDEQESNVATATLTIEEPAEPVIPFNYIDLQNHWANYSASHLAARGLIIGEEIGNRYYFYPDRNMNRSDFMLFLLAITESNEDAEIEMPNVTFADSDTIPSWLVEAAKLAYAKGIIKGSAEGNSVYLNPYSSITRTEAVVMINNVLKPANSTDALTYSDASAIPEWGLQAVKNLTAYQIIQGTGAEFDPNSNITRGQAAEMCFKLVKQLEKDALSAKPDVK